MDPPLPLLLLLPPLLRHATVERIFALCSVKRGDSGARLQGGRTLCRPEYRGAAAGTPIRACRNAWREQEHASMIPQRPYGRSSEEE